MFLVLVVPQLLLSLYSAWCNRFLYTVDYSFDIVDGCFRMISWKPFAGIFSYSQCIVSSRGLGGVHC